MENGTMNGDHHDRSRSPSPGLSRSNSRNSCSKEINRTSLLRRNQSLSAKQIRFYRNGDRFFSGLKLAVSPERYKEFDALLAELSNKLDLSTGAVRFIFNAETGKMITDVNELQYGASYVCSSSNCFKEVDAGYGNIKKSWSLANYKKENAQTVSSSPSHTQIDGSRDYIKPKLVTVIKNGKPPQKKVTMLLNAKTAVNLEQVLDHLSSKGTLGKVDKLHTVDGKQIRELRNLFGDDTMFVALQSNEKFPDEGFDVDVQIPEVRPRWRYAPATDMYSYIPGLRPEPPPPAKTFTVHLHCMLAASMSNLTSPRPAPVRTRSVSPRPTYSRKSFSPSPKSTPRLSGNFEARRPKSAIGLPSEFARKPLMPQASASLRPTKKRAGSDKPVPIRPIRPKAGSDTPVAIRGGPKTAEQKMMPFQTSSPENSDSEDFEGRHGYYVYIYNDNLNKSQGLIDGKPTASVRPMMFSPEEKEMDSNDFTDPTAKLDLKPMMLNLSPADSLETVQA